MWAMSLCTTTRVSLRPTIRCPDKAHDALVARVDLQVPIDEFAAGGSSRDADPSAASSAAADRMVLQVRVNEHCCEAERVARIQLLDEVEQAVKKDKSEP